MTESEGTVSMGMRLDLHPSALTVRQAIDGEVSISGDDADTNRMTANDP